MNEDIDLDKLVQASSGHAEGMDDDAFAALYAQTITEPVSPQDMGNLEVEEDEPESVAKSDTLPGQGEPDGLEQGSEEPPAAFDPVKLADAIDEIRRAGLEPNAFKGKSEGELIALGVELNTRRRQRDREYQEAQGHSKEAGTDGHTSKDAAKPDAPLAPEPNGLDPAKLDEMLTPFVEAYGEEAAPVVDLLKSVVAQNAQMAARLEADAQARQLAPIEQAVNEELAGKDDLSNPDAREEFLRKAELKAELDGMEARPGETQADFIRRVVRNALPEGAKPAQPAAVKRGKQPLTPRATGMAPGAPTGDADFNDAFARAMQQPEFRDMFG